MVRSWTLLLRRENTAGAGKPSALIPFADKQNGDISRVPTRRCGLESRQEVSNGVVG